MRNWPLKLLFEFPFLSFVCVAILCIMMVTLTLPWDINYISSCIYYQEASLIIAEINTGENGTKCKSIWFYCDFSWAVWNWSQTLALSNLWWALSLMYNWVLSVFRKTPWTTSSLNQYKSILLWELQWSIELWDALWLQKSPDKQFLLR